MRELEEAGVLEFMPANFGQQDGRIILDNLRVDEGGQFDEVWRNTSALYDLVNSEDETPDPTPTSEIKKGDIVRIMPHTWHDYNGIGYSTLVEPIVRHEKGGQVVPVTGVFSTMLEDEHGNPIEELTVETPNGLFSPEQLEVVTI